MNRLIAVGLGFSLNCFAANAQVDPALLAGMRARSIGPAGMSGRVAAVEGVATNPNTVYVGGATGGLWKSIDGGLTWVSLFDEQPVHAIGAIAVFSQSPDIVWVGTGEGNARNSVSIGNGLYKSMDGGATFQYLGLPDSERIPKIALHPTDPKIAYIAVLGKQWGDDPERGVYKTVDGGATFELVLAGTVSTGAADLVMDPTNPEKLIASLWDFRREPSFFRSGGPGSGMFVTHDGGKNWTQIDEQHGLPAGELGRIGLAIAPSDANVVYAIVEAEENSVYRSVDGGKSWQQRATDGPFGGRPFYFSQLRVDPEHPNRVYSLWSLISVSEDGGQNFEVLVPFAEVHPDHHTMWINPHDGGHIIEGNDGGVAISRDRGNTWRFVRNLPLAQFYHIDVDEDRPYNVYGGMQDNGSWRGPSEVWENGGIRNHHWEEVCFGDGFRTVPDPEDSMTGYGMSQQGFLTRWNLRTGERKRIRPWGPDDVELRFNWDSPFAIDPFAPATIYYGSQFLHRSRDRGDTWEILSGDLTTNNPEWQRQGESGGLTLDVTGAENYTTLTEIALSPLESGLIWAGSDDGRLSVTLDHGANWLTVEDEIRGLPENCWVSHIEPSKFDSSVVFVTFDDHRRSNPAPYVFRTDDLGATWTSLVTGDLRGYAHVIAQDHVREDLLYLGTEFGLYFSWDGGQSWVPFQHGLPTASVMDLVIHPKSDDLIIGTHGRAAYILDDVWPLRTLNEEVMTKPLHLFSLSDAQQYVIRQTGEARFPGHEEFRGENPDYGAVISFVVNGEEIPHPDPGQERERRKSKAKQDQGTDSTATGDEEISHEAEILILNGEDQVVRTFEVPVHLGLNRATWDLRRDAFAELPGANDEEEVFDPPSGPEVLPGEYTVVIRLREEEVRDRVRVLEDPRLNLSMEERGAKEQALRRVGELRRVLADAVQRLEAIHDRVAEIEQVANRESESQPDGEGGSEEGAPTPRGKLLAELTTTGKQLQEEIQAIQDRVRVPPDAKGILKEDYVWSHVNRVLWFLSATQDAPTASQQIYLRQAEDRTRAVIDEVNQLLQGPYSQFQSQVDAAQLKFWPSSDRIQVSDS